MGVPIQAVATTTAGGGFKWPVLAFSTLRGTRSALRKVWRESMHDTFGFGKLWRESMRDMF